MEIKSTTPSTEAITVPQADSNKPKATSKRKPAKQTGLINWELGSMPTIGAKALKALKVQRKGDAWTNKKGELKHRSATVVTLKTAKQLMEADPKLSEADAKALVEAAGKAIKPAVMARVAAAGASDSFVVRRYSERPGKFDDISVSLRRVNVESTVAKLAREYGLPESEVRKRLGIKADLNVTA